MPKRIEKCVEGVLKNPKFKPRNPKQTKKDAAWAVCQQMDKEGKLSEDAEGKLLFLEPIFLDDFTTVEERTDRDEAYEEFNRTLNALSSTAWEILYNDKITDKKEKILEQAKQFVGLLKDKFKDLNFSELNTDFILFSSRVDPEIIIHENDTVTIKSLPIFQLGEHKGYPYDQDWADNTISIFNQQKESQGFLPPVAISHEEQDGRPGTPVEGFINDLIQKNDLLLAEVIKVPKDVVKKFPYRSVELHPVTHEITSLRLLGANERPYFKFGPTQFKEDKGKIYLTFKDRGGEDKMELSDKDKNWFTEFFSKLIPHKKEEDKDKKVFTEEEVKVKLVEEKSRLEKESQVKFAEDEKKKDIGVLMKTLFIGNGKKEGTILAPRLKAKVETIFSRLDNLEKIKFAEEDRTEKEATVFNLMKEVFSEILEKPDSLVFLGEKTRFTVAQNPENKDKFSEEEEDKVAKRATANLHLKKKKKE